MFHTDTIPQIDIVNSLMLLTAKPVTYLVNLSEKDYIRKKNKWLPKIKGWIDEHNPGDPLIPFSVAFEERLAPLEGQEKKEEEETAGATSALPKARIFRWKWVVLADVHLDHHRGLFESRAHPILYLRSR
jgi:ribosome-binding ATPase YchF (GTP1/OBG family)